MDKESSNIEYVLTKEDYSKTLNKQDIGFEEAMPCNVCEGFEIHIKVEDSRWKCKTCGSDTIIIE
jgi:transposase-like protein